MWTLDITNRRSKNTSDLSRHNKEQIKTRPSPCRRSILQTAAQDTPQISAASQQTANQNQPFPMQTLDWASSRLRNTGPNSVALQQTANQNQPFPMQTVDFFSRPLFVSVTSAVPVQMQPTLSQQPRSSEGGGWGQGRAANVRLAGPHAQPARRLQRRRCRGGAQAKSRRGPSAQRRR